MMTRIPLAAILGLWVVSVSGRSAASQPREVVVTATRLHVGDVAPDANTDAAAVDIGPSPSAGGSRLVTRGEIIAALEAKQLPCPSTIPDAVRVFRKAKHLAQVDVNALVRDALVQKPLGRGVALVAVRADHPVDVADGWARIDVDVPRAPKRQGTFATAAIASFMSPEGEAIARISVPLELGVSAEGSTYDAARGGAVTLVIRRGYIEVRAGGISMADGDVGDVVPIQLRQSGRVLRARLVSRDEAVAVEDGQ
jgi:hypothetical protein